MQPLTAHQHRHIDVSYLNIGGTFYYLCSVLDGFSRYIVLVGGSRGWGNRNIRGFGFPGCGWAVSSAAGRSVNATNLRIAR